MVEKELYEKGDVKAEVKDKKFVVTVGDESKVQNVTSLHIGYVLDKIEEAIPGDQKAAFAMIKGALGVA